MRKLVITLLSVLGIAGFAVAAQAECFGSHKTVASTSTETVTTETSTPILPTQSGG